MYFEDLSIKEQIQLVHCTDILIGIHGAGLEHYRFMRPNTALIQVGWDGWSANHLYETAPLRRHIHAYKMNDCAATISEKAWQLYYKLNPNYSHKSRKEILGLVQTVRHFSMHDNIWKYADCTLNVEKTFDLVSTILNKL